MRPEEGAALHVEDASLVVVLELLEMVDGELVPLGGLLAGLQETRVKKKTSPVGFFGFFGFFYIFAQKREFLGIFQFQEYFKVHPDFKL